MSEAIHAKNIKFKTERSEEQAALSETQSLEREDNSGSGRAENDLVVVFAVNPRFIHALKFLQSNHK